jgi:integrase
MARARATKVDSLGRKRPTTRGSWGTTEQLPSGRYRARYVGPDGLKHAAPVTFTAKVDAESWLALQRVQIVSGTWTPSTPAATHEAQGGRAQRFEDFAHGWIATRISPRTGRKLAPTTRAEYERKLASEDFDSLRELPLASITPRVIQEWYGPISDSGRLTSAARAYQFVHAVLAAAVKEGVLDRNPAAIEGASIASTEKAVQMPTDAELLMIEASMPEGWRAMATIAAWGGLRFGELTELRRKDVTTDGEHVVLSVARGVTYVGGRFVVGRTKSKSGVRRVILTGQDAAVVTDHLDRFTAAGDEALLFPDPDRPNEHLRQSTHYRTWDKVRRAAGRPDMPWHALRHHFGTKVAEHGGTVADVQAALGDSTYAAAMRYVDTAADRLVLIAERMGKRDTAARS